MAMKKSKDVDAYIADHPPVVRRRLAEMRAIVRAAAPAAAESISYRIPAYKLDGQLVYFAAYTTHIGFYPLTRGIREGLGEALAPYSSKSAKATARFPFDRPIPRALVRRMVKIRIAENAARDAARRAKKNAKKKR
jgi:uncharacterized protein YdhG (YjbR/CyaY superfamily)